MVLGSPQTSNSLQSLNYLVYGYKYQHKLQERARVTRETRKPEGKNPPGR